MNVVSRSEKPRALITGARGFTGRYMAERLSKAGYQVFGLVQEADDCVIPGVDELLAADLCDALQVRDVVKEVRPEMVAHLAGIANVAHGNIDLIYKVNIVGSRNLLAALSDLPLSPRCTLLASSANVYGNTAPEEIDESVAPLPENDYGVSKLAMEQVGRIWGKRFPVVVVRPFNYTGVGQTEDFLLPKIVGHFKRGERVIELGNVDVARDFSDVRAVADAYVRLMTGAPAGGVFNVCSGRAYTFRDVLGMMAAIAGYEIDIRVNPAFVRANEVKRLQGVRKRLESVIGEMRDVPLADTLRWMFEAA